MFILGFGFLFTSSILLLSKYPIIKPVKDNGIKLWHAIIIGIMQIVALFPGVSRSGTTISSGMIIGADKKNVAKFSFLMFIPAILGATVLEFSSFGQIDNILALIVGMIFAMITGYIALKLLINIIEKNKFWYFSIYCFILGIIVLLFAYKIV
jgi:undecaprenyl-diphosphatase